MTLITSGVASILIDNPDAEILIIAYSHGANAVNIGLNNLFSRNMNIRRNDFRRNPCNTGANCELDLSNITLVATGAPAMYDYRLWRSTQLEINAHYYFSNNRDFIQRGGARIGSESERMHLPGFEIGRAHHGANNIIIDNEHVPFAGGGTHSVMRTNTEIWEEWMIPRIGTAKGW